jgi:hypothetical protein
MPGLVCVIMQSGKELAMREYDELLLDAYRGEVLGSVLFGAMAAAATDDRQREQLQALQRVEARTAGRLRDLVEAAGLDAGTEQPTTAALQLAEATRGGDWSEFLTTLRAALPPFLANFERLRTIGGDEPVLEDLVAHERAIDRFAELELEGRHADAIDVLEMHLASA